MTLVEVVCAVALLVLGMLGFSRAVLGSMRTNQTARESTLATEAARQQLETIQATALSSIFRTFNADPADDLGVAGTAPGADFAVPGLRALPGDADGLPGEILFPATAAAPGVLRENVGDSALGMPRDLDGDTIVDGLDHAGDYRILPVVVRVTWRGATTRGEVELKTLIADFQ